MSAGLAVGFGVAFVTALTAIEVVRRSPLARILVDRPNERSLHYVPTPRVGGLGLLAGALPVALAFASTEGQWIAGAVVVLAMISAADDAESLPVATRLAVHLSVAAITVAAIGPPAWIAGAGGLLVAFAAVLVITWMANLFNFMDGSDGLAGGMAAIGFAALGVAAHGSGAADLAAFSGAVSAASLAFLVFNFPPARVFMGDAGSVPLGFLAGALGWQGVARGLWPAWFPLLVFSPFIVDATVTLLRRLVAREAIWKAHRSHYYQRLILGGWSHRRLAVAAWAFMFAAGAAALVARDQNELLQRGILAAGVLACVAVFIAIDRRHPRSPG